MRWRAGPSDLTGAWYSVWSELCFTELGASGFTAFIEGIFVTTLNGSKSN